MFTATGRLFALATTTSLAIACVGDPAQGQENPPPPAQPPAGEPQPLGLEKVPPAAQPAAAEPKPQPPDDYFGSPRQASTGGSERKLPEHAGLFPHSPMSYIEPPIKDFEKWTSDNLRLDVGFRAAYFFQQASAGQGERSAAAQDYRAYATWHAFNWEEDKKANAGNVYMRFEYRQEMFSKIPPYQLNTQIGTLFTTTYGQDEHGPAVVQLYYEQFAFDGALRLRAGKLDPDDYFNLGRWADDYRYFDNTLFSAYPASNHPSGGLGWNAQWYIDPEWTVTGGMTDVQGRKVTAGFNTVNEARWFYGLDVTYSPTIAGLGRGNYRVGTEYRNSVGDTNKPDDTSVYINIDQEVAKDVAPFVRYSHGTGRSTAVNDVFSVGLGIDNCYGRPGDAFGVGIGFDTAHDPGPGARDMEYAMETFYRFQLTRTLQWTIGGQLIAEPVNEPTHNWEGIFETRFVFDF